jgi:hypothetical protein
MGMPENGATDSVVGRAAGKLVKSKGISGMPSVCGRRPTPSAGSRRSAGITGRSGVPALSGHSHRQAGMSRDERRHGRGEVDAKNLGLDWMGRCAYGDADV